MINASENYQKFHKPTTWELKDLVKESHVSGKAWRNNTYDCTEFTNDLIAYLKSKGVFSCSVEVNFNNGMGHMLVATELENGEIYYIEPQTRTILKSKFLDVGDSYCDKMGLNCKFNSKVTKISSCYGLKIYIQN
jgi:hypothetical protein